MSLNSFITDSTTSRTLSDADSNSNITFTNSSTITVTLPNNVSVGFTALLLQQNTGQVQCVAASGATITNLNGYTSTAGQYAAIILEVYANSDGSSAVYSIIGQAGPTNSALTVGTQQFSITIAAGSTSNTATITAVTAANAFVLWQGQTGASIATAVNSKFQTAITLTNSTTVTATRGVSDAGNSVTIFGTVIEFTSAAIQSVQQGTIAIGSGSTSNTATITSVTTTNSFVHFQGENLNAAASETTATTMGKLVLTNATTVTASRNTSSTDTLTVGFVVVEFKSGILHSATQATATAASSTTATVYAITTVNSRYSAFIFGGFSSTSGSTNSPSQFPVIECLNDVLVGAAAPTGTITTSGTIIEFTSAQIKPVQRYRDVIVGNTTSITRTIPAVTTGKTAINFDGWYASSSLTVPSSAWETITLTNATTVTSSRQVLDPTISLINFYEVLEFI